MKRSPDKQINASFIDISRIKWLVFLLRSSFFRTTKPLASSEATAYYRPAPVQTDCIPERDQRPHDNGYKSVFTNSWLVRQRNRSWIKGLGKNPQKTELIHWRQCLLSGATEPCHLGLWETMACIHVNRHDGSPCVACLQVFRHKHTKIGMRVQTLSDRWHENNLRVYASSDANWLRDYCLLCRED